MAKFVAKQPVSMVSVSGLTLLSSPSKVTFTHRQDNGFIADNDAVRIKVSGEDFSYFGGRPTATSGTITGIRYFIYNSDLDKYVLQYKLSGAKLKLYDAATNGNLSELTQKVFAGNDTITGSKGDDALNGFGRRDTLNGKEGNDTLHGDGGRDVLIGAAGSDVLDGGKGRDTYVFKADPATGVDTVLKFEKGERLKFKGKIFDGLTKGALDDDQFALGTSATTADHRIIYDPGSGRLWHDADGTGPQAATLVAYLPAGLDHLDAGNIFVI